MTRQTDRDFRRVLQEANVTDDPELSPAFRLARLVGRAAARAAQWFGVALVIIGGVYITNGLVMAAAYGWRAFLGGVQ